MRTILIAILLVPAVVLADSSQPAPKKLDLHPRSGPAKIEAGHDLTIDLPEGFLYLDAKDARKLLEANGNPPNDAVIGLLTRDDADWTVSVRYVEDGYVKDDDAEKLDANAILQAIREGTDEANKYRKEHGFEALELVGWSEPPAYDRAVHHVTWALAAKTSKSPVVNVNTRLLGRKGYASLNLVAHPDDVSEARPEVARLLSATTFNKGSRYEDFDGSHDKVAEYGLAALVAGGAGAFALKVAKVGLIAKFWNVILAGLLAAKKFIFVLVAGGAAGLKRFFGGGKKPDEPPTVG